MRNQYTRLEYYSRIVVLVSYFNLLAVFTVNTLIWPSCNRQLNIIIWGLHIIPMLVFLPSILQKNIRSHAWLSFILLGYFIASVTTTFRCTSVFMLVEVGLITILFIFVMLYIRWRSMALKFLS